MRFWAITLNTRDKWNSLLEALLVYAQLESLKAVQTIVFLAKTGTVLVD